MIVGPTSHQLTIPSNQSIGKCLCIFLHLLNISFVFWCCHLLQCYGKCRYVVVVGAALQRGENCKVYPLLKVVHALSTGKEESILFFWPFWAFPEKDYAASWTSQAFMGCRSDYVTVVEWAKALLQTNKLKGKCQ
jgi:hypothetical protein